jgi:RNA polymerase primary sigma factor
MNPVEEYFEEKLAAKEQRKKDEVALWKRWMDEGQQPHHLAPLLKAYEPVIAQHVRKHNVLAIPESAMKAQAQKHVIEAFQTYDPSKGTALNTWVENRLPKLGRFRNRYQNMAYIPEGKADKIGKIDRAKNELIEELGREPTMDELGDHLSMNPKKIQEILKAQRRDIPMSRSGGEEVYDYSATAPPTARMFEDQQIAVAAQSLHNIFPNKPEMHKVFHYTFGTNGYPQISSTGALAKKMGKKDPQISRMKSQMGATLRKHFGLSEKEK